MWRWKVPNDVDHGVEPVGKGKGDERTGDKKRGEKKLKEKQSRACFGGTCNSSS